AGTSSSSRQAQERSETRRQFRLRSRPDDAGPRRTAVPQLRAPLFTTWLPDITVPPRVGCDKADAGKLAAGCAREPAHPNRTVLASLVLLERRFRSQICDEGRLAAIVCRGHERQGLVAHRFKIAQRLEFVLQIFDLVEHDDGARA